MTSKDIEAGRWIGPDSHAAFLVKSGRTVAFPVYQGTFERGNGVPAASHGAEYLSYISHVREISGGRSTTSKHDPTSEARISATSASAGAA